ncbi:MAG: cupin domain-containing protein [Acidisphaera sp.]|nr:cupin domain-containing protein [Acidisphaera sp.]
MIRHHPSAATLLAGAAGTLPAPHARVVAVHAAQCRECAAALREAEEIGGALLEGLVPAALAPDALARTLARLDAAPASEAPAAPLSLAALATGRWRWRGPGFAMMPLMARDATDSRLDLIRVAPGVALPAHGHTGSELSCVLQGGLDDGKDAYQVGDVAERDVGAEHRPRAMPGEPCICLVAVTGRLRPRGALARLAGRLIGL